MLRQLVLSLCLVCALCVHAQRCEILSDHIATLQLTAGDDWMAPPVIKLGSGDKVRIEFDDLTHEYHRYTYDLRHCEADWTPSEELLTSDYCDGFAEGNTIDDYEESFNTNQLYTHYTLDLPNSLCAMKISGNYEVIIYDEDADHQPVARACFMVVDPAMTVGMTATTVTDKDVNGRHQQVGMVVNYNSLRVNDPTTQIHTVVLQNFRWDNARINAKPQYVSGDGLKWDHCRDYVFDGGNEYRKFEVLDLDYTSMGIEELRWDGEHYNAFKFADEPRPSYVYDEDANGAFFIRNSDNTEVTTTTDYVLVHLRLKAPQQTAPIYVNGWWTYDRMLPQYEMQWNPDRNEYEAALWLKQGYYSYQYLTEQPDGTFAPLPSEGNFHETENCYDALVYYKEQGGRTDLLVGWGHICIR